MSGFGPQALTKYSKSGFTFGPEYPVACISTFSTPVQAYALLTSTPANGALPSTVYQYEISTYITTLSSSSTFTNSSTTILSTGLAVADPLVVAWQTDDYRFFPSDYAASLVARFNLAIPSVTAPPPGGRANGKTEGSTETSGLTTGAKAGIGAGIALGVIAVLAAVVFLYFRRWRMRHTAATAPQAHSKAEMDATEPTKNRRFYEADNSSQRQELDSKAMHAEADTQEVHVAPGPPVELPAVELQHPNDAGRAVYPQRDAQQDP
jgi:hypothetical protein